MVSAYRLDRTGEGPRRAVYSWVYNWLIQALLRHPAAGHQLRVQALPAQGPGRDHAVQRGLVHRRGAGDPGAAGRLLDRADRRRLLPAHPRRVDPVLPGGDPRDARRDDPAARRAEGAAGRAPASDGAAHRLGRRPRADRRRLPGGAAGAPARCRHRDVAAGGRPVVRAGRAHAARPPDARRRAVTWPSWGRTRRCSPRGRSRPWSTSAAPSRFRTGPLSRAGWSGGSTRTTSVASSPRSWNG